jgi:hypothetical protein
VAAAHVFWGLGKTFLSRLCKREGVEVPVGADVFDLCWSLAKSLTGADDDSCLRFLGKMFYFDGSAGARGLEAVLEVEECTWAFEPSDQADMKQAVATGQAKLSDAASFEKRRAAKRVEVNFAMAAAEKKKTGVPQVGRPAAPLPEGHVSQAEAAKWAPPGGAIWRNSSTSGRCGHMPPYRRSSCSGAVHGHRRALLMQLADLWLKHARLTGQPRAACPHAEARAAMQELAPEEAPALAAAAAASSSGP